MAERRTQKTGFRIYRSFDGVFYLVGELDLAAAAEFQASVASRLDGADGVVLDLAELTFVDSTGIEAFLALARRVEPRPLVLRCPGPSVARVFDLVRLDRVPALRIERVAGD